MRCSVRELFYPQSGRLVSGPECVRFGNRACRISAKADSLDGSIQGRRPGRARRWAAAGCLIGAASGFPRLAVRRAGSAEAEVWASRAGKWVAGCETVDSAACAAEACEVAAWVAECTAVAWAEACEVAAWAVERTAAACRPVEAAVGTARSSIDGKLQGWGQDSIALAVRLEDDDSRVAHHRIGVPAGVC